MKRSKRPYRDEEQYMSVRRNEYGAIKRTEQNRDWRRAHLQGAVRLVEAGKRTVDSFGARMKAAVLRWFAV